jgi:glucans biosynthesis protein C
MMLLGIVLHTAINYLTVPAIDVWPYQDERTSPVADALVLGIHTFRMPIFFVMTGFFTALLVERRGPVGMLKNRMLRVVLPFALFWVVVQPLVVAGSMYAVGAKQGDGPGMLTGSWGSPLYWADNTVHLWFLWYLGQMCVMAAIGHAVGRALPARVVSAASRAFRGVMSLRLRALILAVPMVGILLLQGGLLRTALSFVPDWQVLVGYLVFFGFGSALWYHRDLLPTLTQDAGAQLGAAAVLLPVNVAAAVQITPTSGLALRLQASVTGALMVWLLVFGITGLVMRWARHERPWVRYLTDASYWMYLVHLPFMLFVPGLLAKAPLSAVAKIVITLLVVTPVLVASYHWLVRGTALGVLLNGRRYPVASWVPGPATPSISVATAGR